MREGLYKSAINNTYVNNVLGRPSNTETLISLSSCQTWPGFVGSETLPLT